MSRSLVVAFLGCLSAQSQAVVVFEQPPAPAGGLIASSWLDPNGSDADMYAYESFIVPSNVPITEVRWRGGYVYGAPYGHVTNFTITFFESSVGGSQPHITNPQLPEIYLAKYNVGDNAGETPVAIVGGAQMNDYGFVLPTPFQAGAGVKYWIRIEGVQIGYPDWGIALGTGGDSHHFAFSTGAARFFVGVGDTSFQLIAPPGPYFTIAASASPDVGGSVAGGGVFTNGSPVTLTATPNPGYAFVNWTQSNTQVSTAATYQFNASSDRTLVAHFAPAFTIATSVQPAAAGTTTGDGPYTYGSSVTVSATANANYAFVNWTENGFPVSVAASYTFNASGDRTLVANFVPANANLSKVFEQPHDGSGTIMKSAWYAPDGLDGDVYVYDSFVLGTSQTITEVHWRGGYTNFKSGAGQSPVYNFTVSIYGPGLVDSEPAFTSLVQYDVGGNANETPAGTFGGTPMYDYSFVLPTAFHATAGTKYWMQIEAWQGLTPFYYWPPDWGFASATGGNGSHFEIIIGGTAAGGNARVIRSGDTAFSLMATTVGNSITTITSPPEGGSVSGGGVYANGAGVTVTATSNPGFTFVNWNENGTPVSTSASYHFTANANRTLVANFAPSYRISASPVPFGGGTTSGGGSYYGGASVALTATPKPGYVFINWTEGGFEVSTQTTYYFIADSDRTLEANFTAVHTITATVAPAGSGFTAGGGVYNDGATVTLTPTPNAGFAFLNWTEGGAPASNTPAFSFAALADRALVANFSPACSIATSSANAAQGSTGGDGTYPSGASVAVLATPKTGYAFVNWTENGIPVSSAAGYVFTATSSRTLVANFATDPGAATFDFDTGVPALTVAQTTPLDQTTGGITAHFSSASAPAFAIQDDASLGWSTPNFAGHYLYPNVSGSALEINFDHPMRSVALAFATVDSGPIVAPTTVQLTAFSQSTANPPVGQIAATGTFNASYSLPTGVVAFNSATPFDLVRIEIPLAPGGATDFLADNITVARAIPADYNGDGHVDRSDVDLFVSCVSGPSIPLTPGCENRDLDHDGDVDQTDFGMLQRCFSGPNKPADPACAQ